MTPAKAQFRAKRDTAFTSWLRAQRKYSSAGRRTKAAHTRYAKARTQFGAA